MRKYLSWLGWSCIAVGVVFGFYNLYSVAFGLRPFYIQPAPTVLPTAISSGTPVQEDMTALSKCINSAPSMTLIKAYHEYRPARGNVLVVVLAMHKVPPEDFRHLFKCSFQEDFDQLEVLQVALLRVYTLDDLKDHPTGKLLWYLFLPREAVAELSYHSDPVGYVGELIAEELATYGEYDPRSSEYRPDYLNGDLDLAIEKLSQ